LLACTDLLTAPNAVYGIPASATGGKESDVLKARLSTLLAAVLLAGCPGGVKPPPPVQPTAPVPAASPADTLGSVVYAVDPSASVVRILVYRGGALARLGHNHVMTAASLSGEVMVNPDPAKSRFNLSFPVTEMIVDDTQARREAGEDFPGEISQSDRDGTRKNMLRAEVLDAEQFARVSLRSVSVTPPLHTAKVTTRITIKNVSRDIEVPMIIDTEGTRVTATGEFPLKQTDFGIKPFSIGLGALEVVDQLQIRFKVVAVKQ
jgi:hypothetical protein